MDIIIVLIRRLFIRFWTRLTTLRNFHYAFMIAFVGLVIGVVCAIRMVGEWQQPATFLVVFQGVWVMLGPMATILGTMIGAGQLRLYRKYGW